MLTCRVRLVVDGPTVDGVVARLNYGIRLCRRMFEKRRRGYHAMGYVEIGLPKGFAPLAILARP